MIKQYSDGFSWKVLQTQLTYHINFVQVLLQQEANVLRIGTSIRTTVIASSPTEKIGGKRTVIAGGMEESWSASQARVLIDFWLSKQQR